MNPDSKSVRASSSEGNCDKSSDDDVIDDDDDDEAEDDVDSDDATRYEPKTSAQPRRRKRRGSRRVRKAGCNRNVADRSEESHAHGAKLGRKPRSTADSPNLGRANGGKERRKGGKQLGRKKNNNTNTGIRSTSIDSVTTDQKGDDNLSSAHGTAKISTSHALNGVSSRRMSPQHNRTRSPLVYLAKAVTRTATSGGGDGSKPVRRLSTVSSDMIDISSTEREALSYINARNRETRAALSHSGGYVEQTLSRCLKLSCQPLGERDVGGHAMTNHGHALSNPTNVMTNPGHFAAAPFQDRKRPVNLSTLSFTGSTQPNVGARSTNNTQTFSLKYSRTPVPKYTAYNADMFMRNGVFDPVEYLVHNRLACRMRSIDLCGRDDDDDSDVSSVSGLFRDHSRHFPKPILKVCVAEQKRQGLFLAQSKSKCVRFACPETERECC